MTGATVQDCQHDGVKRHLAHQNVDVDAMAEGVLLSLEACCQYLRGCDVNLQKEDRHLRLSEEHQKSTAAPDYWLIRKLFGSLRLWVCWKTLQGVRRSDRVMNEE
jgi:hypothetical protein